MLNTLKKVFTKLSEASLKIQIDKYEFMKKETIFWQCRN